MSKVRNLPETVTLEDDDLFYVVKSAEVNGGRKIKKSNVQVTAEAHHLSHRPGNADGLEVDSPVSADASGNNLEGIAESFSRSDHKHNVEVAAPVTQLPGQPNTQGIADTLARSDHNHLIPVAAPVNSNANGSNDAGAALTFSRSDHKHGIDVAAPVAQTPAQANAEGTSPSLARSDHVHNIPVAAPVAQTPAQANAEGVAATFARSDHVHNIPVGTPVSTGSANAPGSAATFARSDHVHTVNLTTSEAASTGNDTTTSTTDVLMANMTLTPAAGTYLAIWSGSVSNTAGGNERTWMVFYVGGAIQLSTERSQGGAGADANASSTQGVFTVNGSEAIEIRWRVAGGTSTVRARRLTLVKIG